jgi:hypothetical protein
MSFVLTVRWKSKLALMVVVESSCWSVRLRRNEVRLKVK